MQKGMNFDWDAISTGRPSLNNSSSFFFRGADDDETEPDTRAQSEKPTDAIVLQEHKTNSNPSKESKENEKYERAYRYAQIYAEKRKKRVEEEEKMIQEMQQFHAKPAPNFNVKQLATKTSVPKFTIPITPRQMKPERLRKATEKDQNQPPKTTFHAQEAKVLKEQPYKPKLQKKNVVQEPFNLRMSARLQERRQYDQQLRKTKEELALKEAEKRRREEERQLKQLRKQKEFTAKPNPFK